MNYPNWVSEPGSLLNSCLFFGAGGLEGGGVGFFSGFCSSLGLSSFSLSLMNSSSPEELGFEGQWPEDLQNPNTKFIYDYTQEIFKAIQINIASLNTRLGVVIGFAGLMLRFSLDLPNCFLSCLLFKVTACISVGVALGFALFGFLTKPSGEYANAKELLENNYYSPEELLRLQIIDAWNEGIAGLSVLQSRKNFSLNWSVGVLSFSSTCFGLNIILDTIYC